MDTDFITLPLDRVTVRLRAYHDFGFLGQLGEVFCVFDEQDSGNICFGGERDRSFEKWDGNAALFAVADQAVRPERSRRYPSISAFRRAWHAARG